MIRDIEGHVSFENNLFKNNIGMFGGAVHVSNHSGAVLFRNNTFDGNMAYFAGNAVHLKRTPYVLLESNNFKGNYGPNTAVGGALYILHIEPDQSLSLIHI